ncbi:MAG TPA: hypothetical protein VN932_02350 [Rhizomicrobium sp.]|nr:hypothetical protein [Rhizomicrobium sp.]
MTQFLFRAAVAAGLLACAPAFAAPTSIEITATDGKPAANAVVEFTPSDGRPLAATQMPAEAIIDQRNETFLPLVSVVRKGGHVVFTNNDTTMHQVYSFSPIKQFEFEIDQGEHSKPVVFDQSGVAAIGCNIHDQMITYVYVAATPWVALTDVKGHAALDLPQGAYQASVWHPRLAPGHAPPSAALTVVGGPAKFTLAIPLLAGDMPGMKHMHMQSY